jgi:uncharacterized protein (TIGR02147 family)
MLSEELAKRMGRNPKYSLRAFAKTLGLSSSFVSKLMNGQRPFTEKTLAKISRHLDLTPSQIARIQESMKDRQKMPLTFQSLDLDRFQMISDWYHFAILELSTIENVVLNPGNVSSLLGISIHESKSALERLERLGLLNNNSGKGPEPAQSFSTVGPNFTTAATRNQQRQILEMAIRALDSVPFEERDQSSVTLAIPKARVGEAKKKIAAFRREMTELLQRPGKRDSVYHLSVSFYPVTSNRNPRELMKENL